MKLKLAFGAAIVAAALYVYFEINSAPRSPVTNEDTQVSQVEHVEHESASDIPVSIHDVSPTVQAPAFEESPEADTASQTSTEDHFQLSIEAKERIEAAVYDLVSGVEMPTYGYVNDFSCESNSCSIGIHLTETSRMSSNAAKVMTNLNTALLSTDATSDVQIGLVSVSPNESGEVVIRLVTMERRPSKFNVSVDETTGAFTITTNEGAKDDSASQ